MKLNLSFKKVLMTSVAALLGFATMSYAMPKGPKSVSRAVDNCEETSPGPFAFNYAKDIGLTCPSDFYAYGEFLLMLASEDGLDYAITNNNGTENVPLTNGDVQGLSTGSHDLDWSKGFRIGFGFYMGHDAWNIDARWTYLRPRDQASAAVRNPTVLVPLHLTPSVNISQTNANASMKWRAKHNTLDLALGKPYHVSRLFIFNPFAGVRATWLDQNMTYRYSGDINGHDGIKVHHSCDYWGVGLRGGAGSEYLLGAGWNLFANLSMSMLYGKWNVTQNIPIANAGIELDNDFYGVTPNLELALGINWANFFAKNKYRIALSLAYEFQQWWKQNRTWRFYGDGSGAGAAATSGIASSSPVVHGDLAYNGFAFKLQLDF